MWDDSKRINWLEKFVVDRGELLLHRQTTLTCSRHPGLAFLSSYLSRDLRSAIDAAAGISNEVEKK